MFEALYDSISMLLSWRWPTAEGEVTAANIKRDNSGEGVTFDLEVAYKFLVAQDGPYVGLSVWTGALSDERRALAARETFPVGHSVIVRYRPDDPGVNKLDRSVWHGL